MVGFPGLMFYGRNAPWYLSCPFLAVQVYCTRATTVTYKTLGEWDDIVSQNGSL